jgi:hypothetical protein
MGNNGYFVKKCITFDTSLKNKTNGQCRCSRSLFKNLYFNFSAHLYLAEGGFLKYDITLDSVIYVPICDSIQENVMNACGSLLFHGAVNQPKR